MSKDASFSTLLFSQCVQLKIFEFGGKRTPLKSRLEAAIKKDILCCRQIPILRQSILKNGEHYFNVKVGISDLPSV
jgi:hypothetical protein